MHSCGPDLLVTSEPASTGVTRVNNALWRLPYRSFNGLRGLLIRLQPRGPNRASLLEDDMVVTGALWALASLAAAAQPAHRLRDAATCVVTVTTPQAASSGREHLSTFS